MYKLFSILLVISTYSCSLIEPGGQDIHTLNKDFGLMLFEEIKPGGRQLHMRVQTTQKQKCENTEIKLESVFLKNNFIVRIDDLIPPDESKCIENPSYISNQVLIPDVRGTYELNFQIQDIVEHTGTLDLGNEKVSFSLSQTDGLVIRYNDMYRMPDRLVFGSIQSGEPDAQEQFDNFVEHIKQTTYEIALAPGYYSYFAITDDAQVRYLDADSSQMRFDFALAYNGDTENLLSGLRALNHEKLNVKILCSDGESF